MRSFIPLAWALVLFLALPVAAGPLDWPETVDGCHPWAYNWWLGSAVDEENLTKELERYRAGGLGGIHVVPIYGAKGAESRYIDYLSPRWMEMLAFAVKEGARIGVGVDMTTGTGWCFGGPNITPELGGRKLVVKRFAPTADGKLPADIDTKRVTVQAIVAQGPNGERVEITGRLRSDGSLDWQPPGEGWTVGLIGHQFTGTMVKRAAPGGQGPMIDPFSPVAMRTYLERFTAAFDAPGIARPRAMYHDSFEYFGANWSADLPASFAARRGYRVEDEIAALAGEGDADRVARVRCDVGETLSDVVVEDVFPQWAEWCRQRGIKTRNQAHGAPANWLDFYTVADIPETEMFGHGGPDPLVSRFDEHLAGADRDPLISKFASSAAHVSGKPLCSSESGTWLAEHFCETFEELKAELDLLFLSGANHVFYHGCVYSPDDAAWPGWSFYASTQMNPRNPLWREAPILNEYVARCQSMLRDGLSDNDVLLYWPIHDAWSRGVGNMSVHNKAALEGPLGEAARMLWARGYGFDYVSDRLLAPMTVKNGRVQGRDGARWQAIVIPQCRQMPHTTLAQLLELADAGGTVIFERGLPEDVPGLGRLDERRAAFKAMIEPLLPAAGAAEKPVREVHRGQGRVLVGPLAKCLEAAAVRRESAVDQAGLRFIRRRHAEGASYFIVNHAVETFDGQVTLAAPAASAVILDPLMGRTGVASVQRTNSGTTIHLRLEPAASVFVRTYSERRVDGPRWTWQTPGEMVSEIAGPWKLEFIAGGPTLPAAQTIDKLESWTSSGDAAAGAFSGTARYECAFDLPDAAAGKALLIDLGDVRHVARATLNGRDLGAAIMRPYRLAVPAGLVKAQGNELQVEVTNLAANRIRDLDRRKVEWRIFHDANVVNINYRPFDASAWPVFESGLLGPVKVWREAP